MHTCAALLAAALVLVAQPRRGSAARDCYRPCMPSPEVCLADPRQCEDENCNTDPRPVKRGDCPPGFVENLRCVASMRREPLEIYMWGEIPPKPDDRTLPEKIECAPCLQTLRLTFPTSDGRTELSLTVLHCVVCDVAGWPRDTSMRARSPTTKRA